MLTLAGICNVILALVWMLYHYPYFVLREATLAAALALNGVLILWLDAERRKQTRKEKSRGEG